LSSLYSKKFSESSTGHIWNIISFSAKLHRVKPKSRALKKAIIDPKNHPLCIKPLQSILLREDSPVCPIPIRMFSLLCMNSVQFDLLAVSWIWHKGAEMDIAILQFLQLDFAEQVQAVCCHCGADFCQVIRCKMLALLVSGIWS